MHAEYIVTHQNSVWYVSIRTHKPYNVMVIMMSQSDGSSCHGKKGAAPFFARIFHKDSNPYGKFTVLVLVLERVPSTPRMGTNWHGI